MVKDCGVVVAISIFEDKSVQPDHVMVSTALGDTHPIWEALCDHIHAAYPDVVGEWKHYGGKAGWSFKLLSKKRNLLFFVPLNNSFRVRIVLGEKATAQALADPAVSEALKKAIRDSTAYTEGRSIDMDVTRDSQLDEIKHLIALKLAA